MAHYVLPESSIDKAMKETARYVDTGVPLFLNSLVQRGAKRSQLVIKIAGGARMLAIPGMTGRLNIGDNNIAAVKIALGKERLPISAAAIGGDKGRSVHLLVGSGKVMVKTVYGDIVEL